MLVDSINKMHETTLFIKEKHAKTQKIHIWKIVWLFQMQIQDNQQSLDEHGESHHKFNRCHEHNAY